MTAAAVARHTPATSVHDRCLGAATAGRYTSGVCRCPDCTSAASRARQEARMRATAVPPPDPVDDVTREMAARMHTAWSDGCDQLERDGGTPVRLDARVFTALARVARGAVAPLVDVPAEETP